MTDALDQISISAIVRNAHRFAGVEHPLVTQRRKGRLLGACGCGWQGPKTRTRFERAEEDWALHVLLTLAATAT